jgi:hypothetical protein
MHGVGGGQTRDIVQPERLEVTLDRAGLDRPVVAGERGRPQRTDLAERGVEVGARGEQA